MGCYVLILGWSPRKGNERGLHTHKEKQVRLVEILQKKQLAKSLLRISPWSIGKLFHVCICAVGRLLGLHGNNILEDTSLII